MKRVFLDTNILIDYIQARAGGDDANWHPSNHTHLSPLWRKYVAQTLKIHSYKCL